jgi:hypothetical protein
MKKLITSTLFLICASLAVAQTTTDDDYQTQKSNLLSKDKVSSSINLGASIGFLNTSKNNIFTSFVAPKIGYQLSNKFKLNVGMMHYTISGNSFISMNQQETLFNNKKRSISGNLIFVEGQYQLNKKLIMSGAVMYNANGLNKNKKENYNAASIGLAYKITENSSIKFQTTISKGQGNYYSNPFPTSGFNSFGTEFSNGMIPLIR